MPIHDQGYRRYGGHRAPHGQSWVVIARAGIRALIGKRVFLGLLLLGWGDFVVQAIKSYFAIYPRAANLPAIDQLLAVNADTFRGMIDSSYINFVTFVMVLYVGAGLIANDRRANALQIYLSKPLTRVEYVFGKLAILAASLLFVTWIPALALLIVQVVFAGTFTFLTKNVFLLPAITVFAFVKVSAIAFAILALSSLSNSSRYVGILYTALIFFSSAVYRVFTLVTRSTAMSWVSFSANLTQIGDMIFRLPKEYDTPWPVSALVVIAIGAVSVVVLERRVRGVEVVS